MNLSQNLPPTTKKVWKRRIPSTMTTEQETSTAVQSTDKGVTIVDPQGRQADLDYQWMILHPCEIIAENSEQYCDDKTAVEISKKFADTKNQTLSASVRATTARVEATDLFDPELLSTISLPSDLKR
jgi:hypothetical protein